MARTKKTALAGTAGIAEDSGAVAPPDAVFALQFKAMRRSRRLTLDQLSDSTGLDKGYLSRLERGQKAPSIATVMKLAQALEVPVSALFGETIDEASIHVVRAMDRPGLTTGDASFFALSQASRNPVMEAFLFRPGDEFRSRGQVDHGGIEMLFVVDGQIEIRFSDRTIGIAKGDFIQFPGHFPHQLRSVDGMAVVLVVVSR